MEEGGATALRMEILLKVAQFSSLLVFPITAVSMAIVQADYKGTDWFAGCRLSPSLLHKK